MINDRPGIYDIRKEAYEEVLKNNQKIQNDSVLDRIKYFTILKNMNKHPHMDRVSTNILKAINDINIEVELVDILKEIDKIYMTYFKEIEIELEEKKEQNTEIKEMEIDYDTLADFMNEELYSDDSLDEEVNLLTENMLVENLSSAQNTKTDNNNRVLYVDEETADKIYSKIEHYYGKSYLTKSEIKRIQSKNSTNIHSGCRVHFSDGVLRSECDNAFQIKFTTRQQEKNERIYRDNIKVYRQVIKSLKSNLQRILIEEKEEQKISSDSGNIDVAKIWRINRSNNTKVFYKKEDNDKGEFVIDILLDSSGSQTRNQAKIAIQAYIISNALTQINIPNRVSGFNSFLDYTIIKRFKDYDSNLKDTNNIFEYFCAGNNRDGLAIKSITHELLKRQEENKILIILSDGKPNDVKVGKSREYSEKNNGIYKGKLALSDTAKQVRQARQQKINVLGIYTGNERDLNDLKMIYGKDFLYIKDVLRIADSVSEYIKRIIRN